MFDLAGISAIEWVVGLVFIFGLAVIIDRGLHGSWLFGWQLYKNAKAE